MNPEKTDIPQATGTRTGNGKDGNSPAGTGVRPTTGESRNATTSVITNAAMIQMG